ncbi:hypothetical protein K458DRAFT_311083, partial [Lentithecium fluviatile CBS 122367]
MYSHSDGVELAEIKSRSLLGIARLRLSDLSFQETLRSDEHREELDKDTLRLLNVFKLDGCLRFSEENFVDALIEDGSFCEALIRAGLDRPTFKKVTTQCSPREIPSLQVLQPVECLNGMHRIQAAKRFLDRNDQWWIVRLLSTDFADGARTRARGSFLHEQKYPDGMIFRNIRRYHLQGDTSSENMWWARLTETKRRDVHQLLKNRPLTVAFDELLDMPGLWQPELVHYLVHIKRVWREFVPERFRKEVDAATVRCLELRAPGTSNRDAQHIRQSEGLFQSIPTSERTHILQKLLLFKGLIPSLRAFFENQKYLEPCSLILRTLLEPGEKRSLWKSFKANYFPTNCYYVQTSDQKPLQSIEAVEAPPGFDPQKLGYLQLWMFCLRNFPEMTDITPKIESRRKRVAKKYNYGLQQRLGALAWQLGFQTPEAERLAKECPDREQARRFLDVTRPGCDVNGDYEANISNIVGVLREIRQSSEPSQSTGLTSNLTYPVERRCGRPYYDDHAADKQSLYLTLFSHETSIEGGDLDITSLYVKRDLFQSFF